jgi:uncharacterized protein YcbX
MTAMSITVVELRRYPVKSMQGERIGVATIGGSGIVGDRAWGVVDDITGKVLTARREPRLLLAIPHLDGDGEARPTIELPDGTEAVDDAALSTWLGHPVSLVAASAHGPGTYETPTDIEDEDAHDWFAWEGPAGTFHDSRRRQFTLASTCALDGWDVRRFRPNIIVRYPADADDAAMASPEFALVGSRVRLGTALADVTNRVDRCVMTTRPQPGGIERDLDVLRTVNRERGGDLAVGGLVVQPGIIREGDTIELVESTETTETTLPTGA